MMHLSIRSRLIALVGVLLAIVILSSIATVVRLRQANGWIDTLYHDRLIRLAQINTVAQAYSVGIVGAADRASDGAISADDAINTIRIAEDNAGRAWSAYRLSRPAGRERALADRANVLMTDANAAVARLVALLQAHNAEALRAFVATGFYPAIDPLTAALGRLDQSQTDIAARLYAQSQDTYEGVKRRNGGILALVVCAGLAICVVLVRSITRPIEQAVSVAQTVAAGDLTSRIEASGHDETARLLAALRRMNDSLLDIVRGVRDGCACIGTATRQLAAGNLDLSSRTEQQAAALEETASSMDALMRTVRQNADHAGQASRLAGEASLIAARGRETVARVIATMNEISAGSARMSDIVGIIESIAFQTNILALNAAVEAARAGAQGRGFAVVASEVRSLAQRAALATKEIRDLIGDAVSRVASGAAIVADAGLTMDAIGDAVSRASLVMAEIATGSQAQHRGIEQIGEAIAQMDGATQQNAALVEQAAAAAQALEDQAIRLDAAVAVFRLDASHTGT